MTVGEDALLLLLLLIVCGVVADAPSTCIDDPEARRPALDAALPGSYTRSARRLFLANPATTSKAQQLAY